VAAKAAKQKP